MTQRDSRNKSIAKSGSEESEVVYSKSNSKATLSDKKTIDEIKIKLSQGDEIFNSDFGNEEEEEKEDVSEKSSSSDNSDKSEDSDQNYDTQLKDLSIKMNEELKSKPNPDDFNEDMAIGGLNEELLPHQLYAMTWLEWCEKKYPHGGILADGEGMDSILTILAYLKFAKEKSTKRLSTLLIVPADNLSQWEEDVASKFSKDFKFQSFYDRNRNRPENFEAQKKADIVITTYEILSREPYITKESGDVGLSNVSDSHLYSFYIHT